MVKVVDVFFNKENKTAAASCLASSALYTCAIPRWSHDDDDDEKTERTTLSPEHTLRV